MKLIAIACAAVTVAWCLPAPAFRTASDLEQFRATSRIRWATEQIDYVIHEAGAPGVSFGQVVDAAKSMAAIWSFPACSAVAFRYVGSSQRGAEPDDQVNTIEWLRDGWTQRGFDVAAGGLTDVQYERGASGNWEIVEADVYINAENFGWIVKGKPPDGKRDVLSLLLHETGHVLGLLHPCEAGGGDHTPDCSIATGEVDNAVMSPYYDASRTQLSLDDISGVCYLYPKAACDGDESCPSRLSCIDGVCTASCNGDVCNADEVCTSEGCAAPSGLGGACLQTGDCASQDDCGPSGQRRKDGCLRGIRPDGDPCIEADECAGGACVNGQCRTTCASDVDCSAPSTCVDEDTRGICTSSLGGLGEKCAGGDECIGEKCVAIGVSGTCTRSCGLPDLQCPSGWLCVEVEGERVCAPSLDGTSASGGCSTTEGPIRHSWVIALAFALGLARHSRRRTSARAGCRLRAERVEEPES